MPDINKDLILHRILHSKELTALEKRYLEGLIATDNIVGHWNVNVYEMICSVCGSHFEFEYLADQYAKAYHFCPHCGVKMDGGDNHVGQNANDREMPA